MKVKRLSRSAEGDVVLVEWKDADGESRRGYVPREASMDPSAAELDAAVPYGDLGELGLPRLVITPQRVAKALHRQGIWTRAALDAAPHNLREAVKSAAVAAFRLWEDGKADPLPEQETEAATEPAAEPEPRKTKAKHEPKPEPEPAAVEEEMEVREED